jgi:DNA-binding MarR family transcriptional regulator
MDKIHYLSWFPPYDERPMPTTSTVTSKRELAQIGPPDLLRPTSIFDLLNFRIAEFYGLSGSLVTRMCEGSYGITREAWQFIAMLAALGAMSPSDLAARTTVDRSQASKTLKGLSAKKLIYRRTVEGDGRRAIVGLTASGQAMYEQVFPKVVEVHHSVLSELSTREKKVLSACLLKIQRGAALATAMGLVDAHADRRHGGSRASWSNPSF